MTVLFGDLIQRVFKELFEEKERVTIAFRIISGKLNLRVWKIDRSTMNKTHSMVVRNLDLN